MKAAAAVDGRVAVITGAGSGVGEQYGCCWSPALVVNDFGWAGNILNVAGPPNGYTGPSGPAGEMSELFAIVMSN
ncbi:hypothetical protein [Mycobacterium asiaticum]|uniref:Uncharacterized protein n=1 Tax=Mycobacterium asiaticum TaxID=1790 RepID=A0A1A3NBG9_MYCAS|nr:hypothetical protein [Mycobacterium asiaticum]OBK19136.1 hypothetical protein A5636_19570 [Mycobacterium asiaticum]